MDRYVAWRAIKPAEILVIKVRALPLIITRGIFGIENAAFVGIKILDFVAAIFVTPKSVFVLTVKMVVLAGRNNHGNLAFSLGARCVVIRFF